MLMFNVFCREEDDLICITTNEVFPVLSTKLLLTIQGKGEDIFQDFLTRVRTQNFYKPLKKILFPKLEFQILLLVSPNLVKIANEDNLFFIVP